MLALLSSLAFKYMDRHSNARIHTSHTPKAGGRAAGALNRSHWPRQLTGGVREADGSAGIVCVREVA